MNRYYFLHGGSMNVVTYDDFLYGLSRLNAIGVSKDVEDTVFKHESIYCCRHYIEGLCSDPSQDAKAAILFIEQCDRHHVDITNDSQFENEFPDTNVGFWGIEFPMGCGVASSRQITDKASFDSCKRSFFHKLLTRSSICLEDNLRYTYPIYTFESQAITDWIEWIQQGDSEIIEKLIELLYDVEHNPFTAGMGKTEVLKGRGGMSSKRITQEDRLTYTMNEACVTIHRCKEHYK